MVFEKDVCKEIMEENDEEDVDENDEETVCASSNPNNVK